MYVHFERIDFWVVSKGLDSIQRDITDAGQGPNCPSTCLDCHCICLLTLIIEFCVFFLRRKTQIRRELITAKSLFLQRTVNGGESDCHSLSLSHCHLAGHQGVLSSAAYFCEEGRVEESDHINADLPGLQTHARCKALFAQSFRQTNPSQASLNPNHNNNCI